VSHLHWRGAWGGDTAPSPENFGTFSLEMARFSANSVVYFNRNVRLFTARTTTVTVYCWRRDGVLLLGRGWKWLILVQIQLYFDRNVRQFTARTTTVACIHVLLAAEIDPPRYGSAQCFVKNSQ